MPMFVRRPIRRRPANKTSPGKRAKSPVDGGQRALSPTPGQHRRMSTPALVLPTTTVQSLTPQPGRRNTLPFLPLTPQPPRRKPGGSGSSDSGSDSSPGETPSRLDLQHSMLALIASPNTKRTRSSSRLERRRDRDSDSSSDDDPPEVFTSHRKSSENVSYRRHSPGRSAASPRSSPRCSPRGSPRHTPTAEMGRLLSMDLSGGDKGRHPSDSAAEKGRHPSDSSERGATYIDHDRGRHIREHSSERDRHARDHSAERGRNPRDHSPERGRHSSDSSDKSVTGRSSEPRESRGRHTDMQRHPADNIPDHMRHAPDCELRRAEERRQSNAERSRRLSDSDRDHGRLSEAEQVAKERLSRRRSGPADMHHHRRPERRASDASKGGHPPPEVEHAPSSPSRTGSIRMSGRARYSDRLQQIDERQGGDSVYSEADRMSPRRTRNLHQQISIEETDENGECIRVETIAMAERAQALALARQRSPRRSLPTPPCAKTLERVQLHYSNSLKLGHGHMRKDYKGQGHHRTTSPMPVGQRSGRM